MGLYGDVELLLLENEFDKLDTMGAEFRKTDARFVGGDSKLYHLYYALGAIKEPEKACVCGLYKSVFAFEEKKRVR